MREPESVTVSIFGQEYTLKGGSDAEYVQKVAQFVDERMNEVARNATAVSTAKVAILAAVNIADELFREQQKRLENMVTVEDRSVQLTMLLAKEVGGQDTERRSGAEGQDSLPGT